MAQSRMWNRNRKTLVMAAVCATAIGCSALLISCGTRSSGGGGGSGSGGQGEPLPGAILLLRDIVVSQDVTVFYTVPSSATNIRAFRIQASAPGGKGGVETGDEVVIATGLTAPAAIGETRSFPFSVEGVETGPYFVGLRYAVSGQEYRVRSEHTITVSGIPAPVFVSPSSSRSLYGDQTVQIRVNVGDAENPVNWRLFYIAEDADDTVPADELGVAIDEGTRNVVSQLFSSLGVAPGRYRLGISVTDAGQSISSAVASGLTDRILTVYNDPYIITVLSEPPVPRSPRIEIIEPEEDVTVGFGVETVTVKYKAQVFEGEPSEQRVDFFVDTDDVYDGDEKILLPKRPVDETMATVSTSSLEEGEYYLGAVVHDGVNEPVAAYAKGKILKEVTPKLTVTEPAVAINRRPNTQVQVAWTTNLPPAAGKVDVYYRRMTDRNGTLSATENRILAPDALSVKTASFKPPQSGILAVFVRIVLNDGTVLNKQAPALVKVTTRPTVFWLGDLASPPGGEATETAPPIPPDAPPAGKFYGAVFEGHNFEDNCGAAFLHVANWDEDGEPYRGHDFNRDGVDDFLIVSRYGKPEFVNPTGIGVGEGYLIRGSTGSRYAGTYNVNTTSSKVLPGMVFTGIETPGSDTFGLTNVTRMPDVDGDGIDELIFSFPRVANAPAPHIPGKTREAYLVRPNHFTLGGVVIVGSTTPRVTGADDRTGGRIPLEQVGQRFASSRVGPEPDDGPLCTNESCWMADLWAPYEDAECYPDATSVFQARTGCGRVVPGLLEPDGEWDSLVEPLFGFDPTLALPYLKWMKGFPCVAGACPTCVEASAVAWDLEFLPPQDIYEAMGDDTWSSYLECGDDRPCSQFDMNWDPVPNSGMPIGAGESWALDSCTFHYLNMIVESSDDSPGVDCQKEFYFSTIRTGEPYVPYPEYMLSGFFVDRLSGAEGDVDAVWNEPRPPYGARIIGRAKDGFHPEESEAGFSVSFSNGNLLFSAPRRHAVDEQTTDGYAETQLLPDGYNESAGVVYITDWRDLWSLTVEQGAIPPKPHMYLADGRSHIFQPRIGGSCFFVATGRKDLFFSKGFEGVDGGLVVTGRENDSLRHVLGSIGDFNFDGRSDIAIGAPEADPYGNGKQDGALYVLFRRAASLEGDYILDKISLAPNSPERLAGIFIKGRENTGARFGEVVVAGVDFGTNGMPLAAGGASEPELVISSPYADGDRGEVFILFPGTRTDPLITPAGGESISTLLAQRKVARIIGSRPGDLFGFNMANAGDIDGDGYNDLLIAAPGATPRFDSNPFDTVDVLDTEGVDREAPFGVRDDIDGPRGVPNGSYNATTGVNDDPYDKLTKAGLVYVILSRSVEGKMLEASKWQTDPTKPMEISIDEIGSELLPGFIIAGRRNYDQLGGGRASDPDQGNPAKMVDPDHWDNGRSFGLAGAGDIDGDGYADILIGSILADPRIDPDTGEGTVNAGEAYLIYGFKP